MLKTAKIAKIVHNLWNVYLINHHDDLLLSHVIPFLKSINTFGIF